MPMASKVYRLNVINRFFDPAGVVDFIINSFYKRFIPLG